MEVVEAAKRRFKVSVEYWMIIISDIAIFVPEIEVDSCGQLLE